MANGHCSSFLCSDGLVVGHGTDRDLLIRSLGQSALALSFLQMPKLDGLGEVQLNTY
jgi:hypothetical protein